MDNKKRDKIIGRCLRRISEELSDLIRMLEMEHEDDALDNLSLLSDALERAQDTYPAPE